MTEETEVGSLAEETLKLLASLGMGRSEGHEAATCPHGWCPVCRLVEYVASSPELVDDATAALAKVTGGLMELIKVLHPDMSDE